MTDKPSPAPVLEHVIPAVVNIATTSTVRMEQSPLFNDPFLRRFFEMPEMPPQEQQRQSLGSGVIVDAEKGYLVTNYHVIEQADQIMVNLRDRRRFEAKVAGSD